jgi:hypothetical protein
MSVKPLMAMFATIASSFAAPTMVQAVQEKPTMQSSGNPAKRHALRNGSRTADG